jgi:hypothetical protein
VGGEVEEKVAEEDVEVEAEDLQLDPSFSSD